MCPCPSAIAATTPPGPSWLATASWLGVPLARWADPRALAVITCQVATWSVVLSAVMSDDRVPVEDVRRHVAGRAEQPARHSAAVRARLRHPGYRQRRGHQAVGDVLAAVRHQYRDAGVADEPVERRGLGVAAA